MQSDQPAVFLPPGEPKRHAIIVEGVVSSVVMIGDTDTETIEALRAVPCDDSVKAGDRYADGVFVAVEPTVQVPHQITMRKARQALILRGLDDQVEAALNAIADPMQRKLACAEWDKSEFVERDRPLLAMMTQALGWSDAMVDDLFRLAGSLP